MTRRLIPLAVPPGPACRQVLPALRAALDGSGPAVAPYASGGGASYSAGGGAPDLPPYEAADLPDDLAVAIGTSGSTGAPKLALLGSAALAASAAATAQRLGGVGDWLLALPAHHIAGLQVLLRASAWDTEVAVLPDGPFRPEVFAAAADELLGPTATATATATATSADAAVAAGPAAPARPAYVSLVPTQLARLLREEEATARLRAFGAVLVGGAACPADLLARARAAGVRVVTSYGSSETAGGCVYDGRPLACADVAIEDPDEAGVGRIVLGGTMLASGYLGDATRTAAAFGRIVGKGQRVFRTDDLGRLDRGRLVVLGRLDDVIVTGGLKVLPQLVEEAARAVLTDWDAVVVGVSDPDWGQVVALALAAPTADSQADDPPDLERIRELMRPLLPAYALPRHLAVLPRLPLLGIGKPDRTAVRTTFGPDLDRMGPTHRPERAKRTFPCSG